MYFFEAWCGLPWDRKPPRSFRKSGPEARPSPIVFEPSPARRCYPLARRHALKHTHQTLLAMALLVVSGCGGRANRPPTTVPAPYRDYRPPPACAVESSRKEAPMPLNYDEVRRAAGVRWPDLLPRTGTPRVAFLWYFLREDGSVAEVQLWRSSRSAEVDRVALQIGRDMRWRAPTCDGAPAAGWYGHPIALGGAP